MFERVEALFASAATNSTLDAILRQDKLVFFLHLLGLDTTGHAYRPYSKEYLHNIKIVDKGVEKITKLIEAFYGDGKTSYVFTADHGMSDWGSHGDGHPDNTRTPLIAWGSGVAKPVFAPKGAAKAPGHEDGFSADWGFDHIQRHDVSQADVAALMAYLAGLEFPVNSVGELPLAYVAGTAREKAEAVLVNARGILDMYRVKEERKRSTELRYKPYPPLGDEQHSADHRLEDIRTMIDQGKEEEAIESCIELMKLGLDGLRYLQTYDWLFLRALVTAGYLGWIVFAMTTVIDLHVLHGTTVTSRTPASTVFFASVAVALYSVLYIQQSSWAYYAYAMFPIAFWEQVYARRKALWEGKTALLGHINTFGGYLDLGVRVLAFVGLLEALVSSIMSDMSQRPRLMAIPIATQVQGYFQREVFSICFVLAAIWPAFYGQAFLARNKLLIATWAVSCLIMSTFTLLPVVKMEDVNLMFVIRPHYSVQILTSSSLLGGALMLAVGVLYLLYDKSIISKSQASPGSLGSESADGVSRAVLGAQVSHEYPDLMDDD